MTDDTPEALKTYENYRFYRFSYIEGIMEEDGGEMVARGVKMAVRWPKMTGSEAKDVVLRSWKFLSRALRA